MSIGVMTWVWNHSRSRNGARLVLLAIADAASDDGTNAWPSIATLQRKANMKSERTVQAALRELVELGELKIKLNAGPNGTNRYAVVMRPPAESAPPQNLPPAESADYENGTEPDTETQDPPQNSHPANSAPPQNSTETPANSAGEPSMNRPKKKTSSSSPPRERGTPTNGTRIPDNFTITDEMRAWGRQHAPMIDGDAETARFVDYWRAKPGRDATKVDWTATWRNWIRTAAERGQARAAPAPPGPRPKPRRCPTHFEELPESGICRGCAADAKAATDD